jgi:hypothetical protein
MSPRWQFLLGVFATSVALLALNWVLAWFDVMGVAFRTYSISIDVLDKLHELGFPVMTHPGDWPEPTRSGSVVFIVLSWIFYFVVALLVGAFIRRLRFHGKQTV